MRSGSGEGESYGGIAFGIEKEEDCTAGKGGKSLSERKD